MIFTAFLRAIDDLFERRALSVLLKGVGLALALLIAIFVVVAQVIGWLVPDQFTLPFIGTIDWIDSVLSWGAVVLMILLSPFLMAPVASAFIGLFIEEVADAVEERHYPGLPALADKPLAQSMEEALRFFGVVIAANLAALMLMLVPLFWPFAPLIFGGVNGYLLGREYFQMVAARRRNPEAVAAMFARHKGTIIAAGVLMALPLSIPGVNLLVPVLGAATFTHLYHALSARG
ncbi:EI24 domain-containing protein [Pseudothioclava arenosa]|uniref:Cysteine biosynthesis protein CysZ n=1 Tax=Pseudothioclava arenosa TaxID=1795308 RepID=A0A2A4CJF9_9RHOB|nr:EI24 domain-containing protein [Pseudothioclava arenosa]PCD76163.1 hypothetical protein CLN94_10045 [Pseudothioclava arenosa]